MKKRLKVKLFFAWFDFWVGFFYDRKTRVLYLCPLPMCVVSFRFDYYRVCPKCQGKMKRVAHDTGDGWSLTWDCDNKKHGCQATAFIQWQASWGDVLSVKELKDMGYEII